ncbi:uncharacterized GPI-anchored protein At3g06035-like isoform X2 [Telopea speciosissima]|uniref:uncharacterized GPI-anchored protein At3g06035-like isoform X2 n=1 Tax=Telopea speciosissima TaxID=54955 RepID=UPI001CC76CA9|nr:uncharacterized GPI-anchored protein At3g06035-like isoform X2 [Telopea speciosissima]
MAPPIRFRLSLVGLLLHAILLFSHSVRADGEEEQLLEGLNRYRTSLKLPALKENDNADCFADQLAEQYKSMPCTNTTGANTVPGTETQLSNYPDLLAKCQLNTTNTKDGMIMPACVPDLVPSLVLSNYTDSQYSGYLNDSKYTGAGIGSEGNWIVVVLNTDTPAGSFESITSLAPKIGVIYPLLTLFLGFFLVLVS